MRAERRLVLQFALAGFFLSTTRCGWSQFPDPTKRTTPGNSRTDVEPGFPQTEPLATKPDSHGVSSAQDGCWLTAASSSLSGRDLVSTSGVAALDRGLITESQFMRVMFGANPLIAYYSDGSSPNAFATPDRIGGHSYPDGTVGLGLTLCESLLHKFKWRSLHSQGDHAIVAVLGHEFAHIVQFKNNLITRPVKPMELQADFLSGGYMAARAIQLWNLQRVNFDEAAEQMFSIGDLHFGSPNHHGTPKQRLRAYIQGGRFSFSRNGTFTLQEAISASKPFM